MSDIKSLRFARAATVAETDHSSNRALIRYHDGAIRCGRSPAIPV